MTPIEFLHRLKQLPADTALNLHQLIAAFDMLSPMLDLPRTPHDPELASIEDVQGLADWLNEPISTLEAWHAGDAPQHYQLGAVLEWVNGHLFSIQSMIDSGADNFQIGERIAPYFENWLPCMLVDGGYVEYFTSFDTNVEPDEYRLFESVALALDATRMSKKNIDSVMESVGALGDFRRQITSSVSDARKTFETWKDKAIPEVLEQFLVVAFGHDQELATEISKSIEDSVDWNRFRLAAWLWEKWMLKCSGLNSCDLTLAFDYFTKHGVSVNQYAQVLDSKGYEVFQGTSAHILADTMGEEFQLPPLQDGCEAFHEEILASLLDIGLDVDKSNNRRLTARKIAENVDANYGAGTSSFLRMVESVELKRKIEKSLAQKTKESDPTSI